MRRRQAVPGGGDLELLCALTASRTPEASSTSLGGGLGKERKARMKERSREMGGLS